MMTLSDDERRRTEEEMRRARIVGHAPPSGPVAAAHRIPLLRRLGANARAHLVRLLTMLTIIAGLLAAVLATTHLWLPLFLLAFAIAGAVTLVRRSKDKIRGVAWVLIAAGPAAALLTINVVRFENHIRLEVWKRMSERSVYSVPPLPERMSPSGGLLIAGLLVAFGVLLLAIRRPER